MGTIIELVKERVTVEDDLLTVQKKIQEEQFIEFTEKHTPHHTVIINRDMIITIKASKS